MSAAKQIALAVSPRSSSPPSLGSPAAAGYTDTTPRRPTTSACAASSAHAPRGARVRRQLGRVHRLLNETEAANALPRAELGRMNAEGAAAAAAAAPAVGAPRARAPSPSTPPRCPRGCTRHGNCNGLTGECACPLTHRGPACDEPTMPACATGVDDGTINLSWLVSEAFWYGLRDIRSDGTDGRRQAPNSRWVGVVPCACVLQAIAVFSMQAAPAAARWPPIIGHTELALQRLACVDTTLSAGECGRPARAGAARTRASWRGRTCPRSCG